MAFDRANPAHLATLKNEVLTDPIGMGYNPAGNDQQLLTLLNDPDNNVGGETAARDFDLSAMLDALDPENLPAQQTNARAGDYCMLLAQAYMLTGDISMYKARWRSMFAANSTTVTALDAQTAPLSRAEVLFGQGTILVREDWYAARDS